MAYINVLYCVSIGTAVGLFIILGMNASVCIYKRVLCHQQKKELSSKRSVVLKGRPILHKMNGGRRGKFKAVCKDFLANSSMHGLRYIGEDDKHLVEKILWTLMFALGVTFSTYYCWAMLNKFNTSPSVMSIESTDKKLSEFPFPSVTVCSQNKISKLKLKEILRDPRYKQFDEKKMMTMMRVMIKVDAAFGRDDALMEINQLLIKGGISVEEVINITIKTMVSCEDLLLFCRWQDQERLCSDLFEMRPTDDGICCGFNPIETGWNIGKTKLKLNKLEKVHLPGYRIGLTVALDNDLNDWASTTGRSNGWKVLLHNPPEYPEVGERGFLVSPGYEVSSGLNPMSSYNSPDVNALRLDLRGCYMESENVLEFYSNYSVSRCLIECLTRKMLDRCSCRPYFYEAKPSDPICNPESYVCLNNVFSDFRKPNATFQQCGRCYPSCQDVWYFNELSMASFPGELFIESEIGKNVVNRIIKMKKGTNNMTRSKVSEYLKQNVAILNVFYKEITGYSYRTDVRYGIDDFISAMGGLLGLGFGFSVISGIEILYFFTIRWYLSKNESPQQQTGDNKIEVDIITEEMAVKNQLYFNKSSAVMINGFINPKTIDNNW